MSTLLTPKQTSELLGISLSALTRWRNAGKVPAEKIGRNYLYDAIQLYAHCPEAREAIDELVNITTRTEGGTPFWQAFPHWRRLEAAGLVEVIVPVHSPTGIAYGEQYWEIKRTEQGEEIAREIIGLREDGYFL